MSQCCYFTLPKKTRVSGRGAVWPGHRVGMDVPAVLELSPPSAPSAAPTQPHGFKAESGIFLAAEMSQDKMGSAK